MRIEGGEDGTGSEALRLYAERRVLPLLGRLERGGDVVTIRLASQTDRQGRQTRCRLLVRVVPWAQVVVEEIGPDAYRAIDRAAERLSHTVGLARQAGQEPAGQPGRGKVELTRA